MSAKGHGTNLLVVGAAPNSLGEAIVKAAVNSSLFVATAGISGERFQMDVLDPIEVQNVLNWVQPMNIVVTTGINVGSRVGEGGEYLDQMEKSFAVNVTGVMGVLNAWLKVRGARDGSFVAVSSNSAHIARSNSAPYCASKAALSMAIRVAARELQGAPLVYCYEFGLLRGTPMTQETEKRFGESQTRMPGQPKGLYAEHAAERIVGDVVVPWVGLNGVCMRYDAGEQ